MGPVVVEQEEHFVRHVLFITTFYKERSTMTYWVFAFLAFTLCTVLERSLNVGFPYATPLEIHYEVASSARYSFMVLWEHCICIT